MFDGTRSTADLRRDLLALLRSPEPGWDFRNSDCCALGMVARLVGCEFLRAPEVARMLGIDGHQDVFLHARVYGVRHLDHVMPAMVANRLEDLFALSEHAGS